MKTISFGENTIFLPKIDSTNIEAWRQIKERNIEEGTMVWTNNQTQGKGAANNFWASEPEKNITLTFIVYPEFLEIEKQFYLNKCVSLAVRDSVFSLLDKNHKVNIKWPNDIIVNNNKIGGILIENAVLNNSIKSSVIGIGLNVNQEFFPNEIKNPTSLKNISNRTFEIFLCAEEICHFMKKWYNELIMGNYEDIDNAYLKYLLFYKKNAKFLVNSKIINGEITGISGIGKLQLKVDNGHEPQEYAFKEIEFLL